VPAPLLSAIMIVKNEEANLPRCLSSLRGVADEVVVVDTGSSDRTVEIAREFESVVSFFPWNGREADARNASIAAATGRWLLMIDADETVSAELSRELRPVLEKLEGDASINSLSVRFRNHYLHGETGLTRLLRIGRNRAGYAFSGSIHPTCNYLKKTHDLAGHLEHYGYQWTEETRLRKSAHMLDHLLPLCAGDHPPLKALCELMTILLLAGDYDQFTERWRQALAYPQEQRLRGPDAVYWLENMANILIAFARRDDFVSGRAEAEAILGAHPGHVAANFYLLQAAVWTKTWQTVENYATTIVSTDLQVPNFHQIVYPERQLLPGRGGLWLAQINLGKIAPTALPTDLHHTRLAHVILAAQAKLGAPLSSDDPAVTAALRIVSSLQQSKPGEPAHWQPLLTKLERLRTGHPPGSLPHLLAALSRAELYERTGQTPALIAEVKALADDYANFPFILAGLKELSAKRTFSLAVFHEKFLHQA
jgi:glycosyltransferase involved in cell wall biosynthesis